MQLRQILFLSCLGILTACAGQPGQTTGAATSTQPSGPSPQANAVLQQVSATLTHAHSLAFNVDVLREVQMDNGTRVNLVSRDTIVARRPDRLRADLRGDTSVANIYYDGQRVVIEEINSNLYAAAQAPSDINGVIDMLQDRLGVPLTIGTLLRTDAQDRISRNTSGDVVTSSMLDGKPVDHLLMTSGTLKWELWVSQGERALPMMLVTTRDGLRTIYKFSNWRLNPSVPEGAFHYTPRPGAHEIPFIPLRADQRG